MNVFRCTPDRSLDKRFLRICAVYRLLKRKRIGYARACEILGPKLRGTVDLWRQYPIKDMLP